MSRSQNITMEPKFPPDIWRILIGDLDCESILSLNLTCSFLHKLNKSCDSYMKRKFKGFPRKDGHCRSLVANNIFRFHCHASTDLTTDQKIIELNNILAGRYERVRNKHYIKTKSQLRVKKFEDAIGKISLIRGDTIVFASLGKGGGNNEIAIYNGHKIIHFYRYITESKKYEVLSPIFAVSNIISPHYWLDSNIRGRTGINTYCYFWLDLKNIREQCLKNIFQVPPMCATYTSFLSATSMVHTTNDKDCDGTDSKYIMKCKYNGLARVLRKYDTLLCYISDGDRFNDNVIVVCQGYFDKSHPTVDLLRHYNVIR